MADTHEALLVTLVLDRLFEFLNVPTLKTCRLVCKAWNVIGARSLSKRSLACITNEGKMEEFKRIVPKESDSELNFKNFKIFETDMSSRRGERHLVQELLADYGSTIRSLEILSLESPGKLSIAEVLTSLPLLEELFLLFTPANISNYYNFETFRRLKVLGIHLGSVSSAHADNGSESTRYLTCLLEACHMTLQKLSMHTSDLLAPLLCLRQAGMCFKDLRHLVLKTTVGVNIDMIGWVLAVIPNLDRFECYFSKNLSGEETWLVLSRLTRARHVAIMTTSRIYDFQPPIQFSQIPLLPLLESLVLHLKFAGDAGVLASNLPNIRRLQLVLDQTNSGGWNRMTYLEELTIKGHDSPKRPESFGFKQLNFPALTKLTILLSHGMGKFIFGELKNLMELIAVPGSTICDEDITGIKPANLELAKLNPSAGAIRSRPYIGDLKNLRFLYLPSIYVTNDAIKYGISHLHLLTNLTLRLTFMIPILEVPQARVTASLGTTPLELLLDSAISIDTYKLDLEPLMYPRLPYLVQLTVLTNRHGLPHPPLQEEHVVRMKSLRPQLSYSETRETNSYSTFSRKYKIFAFSLF